MNDYPNTITAAGVELQRGDPGHNDAYWSASIGPVRVALWTRDGHWWSHVVPPASLCRAERLAGPLPCDDAIAALEREVRTCLEALEVARANFEAANAWRAAQ